MPTQVAPDDTPQKAATLAGWKKNRVHTITLPSGTIIDVVIPDLPSLVKTGGIPNELVQTAIDVANGDRKVNKEDIVQQADFYNKLCAITVVAPAATEEDFASGELPFEDKEMIVEVATRRRDIDAVGHHLAGLEKVKAWRTFRNLDYVYQDLESE